MGVPAFFRWLSRKYPSVIIECVENKEIEIETGKVNFENATLPNPNGIEFDNLYLDMNGIIHPCTHPEDKPPPKTEDEMMIAIFDCIDRLFGIVRPRKLLYMAIDGVAPRAKMNQQRSRRFRAAKESSEKKIEIQRIRDDLISKGCILPELKEKHNFDSNCITPGTPFMDRLSNCLHYYIHDRLNNNPAWQGIKIILSDANVPGEGEHKIMDFIRKQRSQPDHDPNTQHVLCGADADLIMLGLATHEPNFTIIREEFLPNKQRPCEICEQIGHEMGNCPGVKGTCEMKPDIPFGQEVKYIFVRLSVLREYLKKTLEMPNLPFKYDFERVLDDWVFMCFFVGNDFLPHLPSLEIREGAVDRLVELYKKCVYRTGGYLTDSGEVNLERVQMIMTDLGSVEDQIFKERQRREQHFKEKSKKLKTNEYDSRCMEKSTLFSPTPIGNVHLKPQKSETNVNYKEEAVLLRTNSAETAQRGTKRKLEEDAGEDDCTDEVRLWEHGFKDRYYESKFDVSPDNLSFRYSVALQYVRGLCWVLKYYYQGCASWNWYFPYHYAPFASDFVNITGLSTSFDNGTKPFNPLEQLMGVFPAASSSHVPKPWAKLMSDPHSPIIDFYPEDFKIDLNGKKYAWQGVALLPFVDERRLFKALKDNYFFLTEEEIRRNKQGDTRLYIGKKNTHYNLIKTHSESFSALEKEINISLNGMRGIILKSLDNVPFNRTLISPIQTLRDISDNGVITVSFRDPIYSKDFVYQAKRLPNAIDPPRVLGPEERTPFYKPIIGFAGNVPSAHVSPAVHRMISRNINYRGGRSQANNTQIGYQYGNEPLNHNRQQAFFPMQRFGTQHNNRGTHHNFLFNNRNNNHRYSSRGQTNKRF